MRIVLASITPRKLRLKSGPAQAMVADFVKRASRYAPVELATFDTEDALLQAVERTSGRTPPHLVLLDSRGKHLTSTAIADHIRHIRDTGTQQLFFAIGPADGWTEAALKKANLVLSLGAITLPHELALVVLAEQIYRAQTILAGHPYHSGH